MSIAGGSGRVVFGVCAALALLSLLAGAALRAEHRLSYPPARRAAVVDDYHGIKVADPYRWLEDLDSPETRAWVEAQARLTQAYLQGLPVRARLRARIGQLYDFVRTGIPCS